MRARWRSNERMLQRRARDRHRHPRGPLHSWLPAQARSGYLRDPEARHRGAPRLHGGGGTLSADPLLELAKKVGGQISAGLKARTIVVPPVRVHEACVGVSRMPGFYHLSTITAVDEGET